MMAFGTALVMFGCAGFSTNLFRSEQTLTGTAYTAYIAYTNGLSNGTITPTVTESNAIKQARIRFAAGVLTVEGWRQAYQTNSAVMNQAQAALGALAESGSNLIYTINLVRAK
jgi:hypothetical protein